MRRYITPKDAVFKEDMSFDVVVIGSGIAGLYTALNLDKRLKCAIITKEHFDISNSWLAQGGIAAAVSKDDRPEFHYEDTLKAGAGLCNKKAVRVLVDEGPKDIATLLDMRVPFDLSDEGTLRITREGGHTKNRVVHAHGDATGRETVKALAAMANQRENITFVQNSFLLDILTSEGRVCGITILGKDGYHKITAPHVVICTGGVGRVYLHTTNPSVATGDGIAAAVRAGAQLKNMEFVQFHPTGLYSPEREERTFLISEALRGEGALLVNKYGERFMVGVHPMAELAPRDIVARGIVREMLRSGEPNVYLDITGQTAEHLSARFPTIYGECMRRGFDISKDRIPVTPVQHFMMGGIETNLFSMTNIPGLFACGEAAHTGVHGANRLASNSMLECLVFGRRAAQYISSNPLPPVKCVIDCRSEYNISPPDFFEARNRIQETMTEHCWVIRNRTGLEMGLAEITMIRESFENANLVTKEQFETYNMSIVSWEILAAALMRRQSIGAHYIED